MEGEDSQDTNLERPKSPVEPSTDVQEFLLSGEERNRIDMVILSEENIPAPRSIATLSKILLNHWSSRITWKIMPDLLTKIINFLQTNSPSQIPKPSLTSQISEFTKLQKKATIIAEQSSKNSLTRWNCFNYLDHLSSATSSPIFNSPVPFFLGQYVMKNLHELHGRHLPFVPFTENCNPTPMPCTSASTLNTRTDVPAPVISLKKFEPESSIQELFSSEVISHPHSKYPILFAERCKANYLL